MTRDEAIAKVKEVYLSGFLIDDHACLVKALEKLGLLQFDLPKQTAQTETSEYAEAELMATLLGNMRRVGWRVATHHDYRLNGNDMTFWLFVHPNGDYVKGEALTDVVALRMCENASQRIRDE
jgi:hypothetical protein